MQKTDEGAICWNSTSNEFTFYMTDLNNKLLYSDDGLFNTDYVDGSQPTCNAANVGKLYIDHDTGAYEDALCLCRQTGAVTYAWEAQGAETCD